MEKVSLLYSNHTPEATILRNFLPDNCLIISDNNWTKEKVIKKSSAQMVPLLKETLENCIAYIETEKDIKNLTHIITKSKKDNARLLVLVDVKKFNLVKKLPKDLLRQDGITLLLIGNIFNSKLSASDQSKIFQNAIEIGQIEVGYDKDQEIALVSESEFKKQIEKALQDRSQKITLIYYDHPQTMLGAAIELVKKYPEVKITYNNQVKANDINHKKIIQETTVHFEKKPMYMSADPFITQISGTPPQNSDLPTKKRKRSHKKVTRLKGPLKILGASVAIFILLLTTLTALNVSNLYQAYKALQRYDLPQAVNSLEQATKYAHLTGPLGLNVISYLPLTPNLKIILSTQQSTARILQSTLSELDNAFRYQNFQNSQNAIADLTYAYFKFSKSPFSNSQAILGEETSKIASILQMYQEITGVKEEKNYLLLFQNNSELRPTGGFIGSVGELKVKDGKIIDLTVRDVYELDGQLTRHVEPHYIIRRYLQPHLYLRDSNFDIEFDRSAVAAAQIYNAETDKEIDGVIAIDFEVVKKLLENTGTLTLTDQNITIDKNTAQQLIQDTIQDNFFPGSGKKKDILQSLMTTLILKLESDPKLAASFAKEIPELLEEKHIMFTFQDPNMQKLFSANDYTGSINDTRPTGGTARNDIFGINEANIGVNKANESLERRVEYEAYMGQNSIISKATLNIFNTGKNSQDYKAYIRVIIPKSSTLESLEINGVEQTVVPAITDPQIYEARGYNIPKGLEVDEKEEDEYKTIGFTVTVPKMRTHEITILYTNGLTHTMADKIDYSLLVIKQPGTTDYPFKYTLRFPDNLTTKNTASNSPAGEMKLNTVLEGDTTYITTLTKK